MVTAPAERLRASNAGTGWPSKAGRTTYCGGNGVRSFSPDDLEVVVLRVAKVGRPSHKELGVNWLLRDPGAGVAHLVGQRVHGFRGIDSDANTEPDPTRTGIGFASPVRSELRKREYGEDDTSQFEGGKIIAIHDLGPAETTVEITKRREVPSAQRDEVG